MIPSPDIAALATTRALAECLLDLHRATDRLDVRELQGFVFERFASVVPFDSGLIGSGVFENGVPQPYDVVVDRLPDALMASWAEIRHLDRLTLATLATPWRTVNADVVALHDGCPPMLEHQRRFGIASALSTITFDERLGLGTVLSLYRSAASPPFTEAERTITELFVPHLVEALRATRIAQLHDRASRDDAHRVGRAIVNSLGVVLEAESHFGDLVAGAFRGWAGPRLPAPIASEVASARPVRAVVERLAVRTEPRGDLRLVRLRRATVVDSLTPRELEVAREFATGASASETAAALGVAVNTVRSHLGRVYEKLGVLNKAELATMLIGYD